MDREILGKFEKQMESLFEAINACIDKKLTLPSLMLIYTGIDIIASLDRKENEGTKKSFTRWAENYILNQSLHGSCTAIELYGARCGVLHMMSPKSDLSKEGKAREVCYAWGNATANKLELVGGYLGLDYPVIHISKLNTAFQKGVRTFLSELADEKKRLIEIVENKKGMWFSDISTEIVDYSLRGLSERKQ